MTMQQRYIDAMNSHDPNRMVSLFAPDGVFDDKANAATGRPPIFLQGTAALEKMFANFFMRLPSAKLVAEYDDILEYDVSLQGIQLKCRAKFTIVDGKIVRLEARPRT